MQYKLLSILGVILIMLSANQCKCSSQPVHDTINIGLQWGSPQPIDLAGLDLNTANGLSCRVPSENASYFINAADGKAYKFTQEGGTLECQASGNVTSFSIGKAFVFAAGSMKKQNLYLGTLNGGQVTIHQLEEGNWKQAITQNIAASFPGGSAIQEDKFIVACTLQLDGQQQGCIMLILKNGAKFELGCLLFDPTKKNLTKVNIGSYPQGITNDTYLIGTLGIKPGKVVIGKGYDKPQHKDSYDILKIEANTVTLESKDFKNNSSTIPAKKGSKTRWELFLLVDTGVDPAIPIPMFTLNEPRSFFRLNSKSDFQPLTTTPSDIANKPSLVIPLGDKLCLVTTRPKPTTDEQQNGGQQEEETIYYQAQLGKDKEESSSDQNQDK